eukprot:TRINITY_DN129_c0_g1_i3.p1 TRINITY_DN129_c0_g1~~TRINITY_DN129_c0_g1_i3.p1  ORF type:complete len:153 (+),score=37.73 TRINITY_DN129_c0_g1_i3:196-654(+)
MTESYFPDPGSSSEFPNTQRRQAKVDEAVCHLEIINSGNMVNGDMAEEVDHYIRDCDGLLLVYDISDDSSWDWFSDLDTRIKTIKDADWYPFVICGNKCDIEEAAITPEDVKDKLPDASVFEISAKERLNIEEVFFELVRLIDSTTRNITVK